MRTRIINKANGLVMMFLSFYLFTLLPLSVFIFLWVNDTGAYCVGSLIGRHKLSPRISPAKSWEGSIGGALFVLAAAYGIGWLDNMEILDAEHASPIFRGILSIPEW